MAALTAPRTTPQKLDPMTRSVPLLANAKVYQGGMVQIAASTFAVAAVATAANVTIGRARQTVDNAGGANGAVSVEVDRGVHRYANSASGDLITRAEIGKTVYVVDDQTVAKTDNSAARPAAGTCYDVDAQGVWVEFK